MASNLTNVINHLGGLRLSGQYALCSCIIQKPQFRSFFGTSSDINTRTKVYKNRKLLGYSMQEMYNVVSDVEKYENFLPFCRSSRILVKQGRTFRVQLDIGFPPIQESYISNINEEPPHKITVTCTQGRVLNHLETAWFFSPGLKNNERSCIVDFYINFEFRSLLYSQLANYFFSQLVEQMEKAFVAEARRRYGEPTTRALKLTLVDSDLRR